MILSHPDTKVHLFEKKYKNLKFRTKSFTGCFEVFKERQVTSMNPHKQQTFVQNLPLG